MAYERRIIDWSSDVCSSDLTRAELLRHAETLAEMTPARRAAFEKRVAQWDAQLPAVQRERREAWQAWSALPEAERRQSRAAAEAYSALPPARQQELPAKYDALDGSERRGWNEQKSVG